eukprot:91390-Rhodomonas_salina.3
MSVAVDGRAQWHTTGPDPGIPLKTTCSAARGPTVIAGHSALSWATRVTVTESKSIPESRYARWFAATSSRQQH